jgi:YidC/Oxa1 family membrane protein insertase
MATTIRSHPLASPHRPWDVLLPLHRSWWAVFGGPLLAVLQTLVGFLAAWPVTLAIGPFGLAVVVMTLLVRFVLLPLAAYQLRASLRSRREAEALNRRLAPRAAALRRRYRRRPAELRRALSELLREEGAHPLTALGAALRSGLLPALVQMPLLVAFYWAVLSFAHAGGDLHFLWVANLAIPDPLLLPTLAGLTTYLVWRLATAAQPPSIADDEQSNATRRTLALLYPLGLAISAHFAPAALVLYWVTGNLVSAAQQWAINRFVLRLGLEL